METGITKRELTIIRHGKKESVDGQVINLDGAIKAGKILYAQYKNNHSPNQLPDILSTPASRNIHTVAGILIGLLEGINYDHVDNCENKPLLLTRLEENNATTFNTKPYLVLSAILKNMLVDTRHTSRLHQYPENHLERAIDNLIETAKSLSPELTLDTLAILSEKLTTYFSDPKNVSQSIDQPKLEINAPEPVISYIGRYKPEQHNDETHLNFIYSYQLLHTLHHYSHEPTDEIAPLPEHHTESPERFNVTIFLSAFEDFVDRVGNQEKIESEIIISHSSVIEQILLLVLFYSKNSILISENTNPSGNIPSAKEIESVFQDSFNRTIYQQTEEYYRTFSSFDFYEGLAVNTTDNQVNISIVNAELGKNLPIAQIPVPKLQELNRRISQIKSQLIEDLQHKSNQH